MDIKGMKIQKGGGGVRVAVHHCDDWEKKEYQILASLKNQSWVWKNPEKPLNSFPNNIGIQFPPSFFGDSVRLINDDKLAGVGESGTHARGDSKQIDLIAAAAVGCFKKED